MVPHPTIPNFYIIPDYIAFQSIFFNAYEPIDTKSCLNESDITLCQYTNERVATENKKEDDVK